MRIMAGMIIAVVLCGTQGEASADPPHRSVLKWRAKRPIKRLRKSLRAVRRRVVNRTVNRIETSLTRMDRLSTRVHTELRSLDRGCTVNQLAQRLRTDPRSFTRGNHLASLTAARRLDTRGNRKTDPPDGYVEPVEFFAAKRSSDPALRRTQKIAGRAIGRRIQTAVELPFAAPALTAGAATIGTQWLGLAATGYVASTAWRTARKLRSSTP